MIIIIALIYSSLVYLLFFKLKLLPWNQKSKGGSILVGVVLLIWVLIMLGQGSPQATGGIQITTRTVNLQAYSTGRVTKVHVKSYHRLKKGDPIVEIDKAPYEYEVGQAEAGLAAAISGVEQMKAAVDGAKANVSVVKANIQAAQSQIDIAHASLDGAKAGLTSAQEIVKSSEASARSATDQVDGAKADVEKNESNVKTAEIQVKRILDLVAEKVVAKAERDTANNKLVAAQSGLKAAQSSLSSAKAARDSALANAQRSAADVRGAEANIRAAQATEQKARDSLLGLEAQRLAAEASLRKAEAQLDSTIDGEHTTVRQAREQLATAQYNLKETVIYAPANGYVAALAVTEGDMLKFPQFGTFVTTEEYFAIATFSQTTVRHIKPGQRAEIAFASRPGEIIEAEVDSIVWVAGEAQLTMSGSLPKISQIRPSAAITVRFKLKEIEGFEPEMGQSGTVAIYTDHGESFGIIRKIMLRMQALLFYLG